MAAGLGSVWGVAWLAAAVPLGPGGWLLLPAARMPVGEPTDELARAVEAQLGRSTGLGPVPMWRLNTYPVVGGWQYGPPRLLLGGEPRAVAAQQQRAKALIRWARQVLVGQPVEGRPAGTTAWASVEEFRAALARAVTALRQRRVRPTQRAVAMYLDHHGLLPAAQFGAPRDLPDVERQLRRWCRWAFPDCPNWGAVLARLA